MNKTQTSIKISLTAVLLASILTACGARGDGSETPTPSPSSSINEPAPTETASETPSEESDELIVNAFRKLALAGGPADELYASLEKSIEGLQPAQADELIRSMEAYYDKNLPVAEEKIQQSDVQQQLSQLKWPITEDQIHSIKDDDVRQLVEQTIAGGYKLETAEGFYFPVVDYGKLLSFGDKVSIAMKAYLDLMGTESDAPTAKDAGLVITWDELASRTLAAESYIVTFPDTAERAKVEDRYHNYLSMYLVGLNNTPIFDYDTFAVLPDVKKQYEQMVVSHGGTITGQLAKELLDVLSETGGFVYQKGKKGEQIDIPAMKQFRENIVKKAQSKLPAVK
ncbi:hypothetical protein [Cohnella terricola]|uniref:Uncharacterized protein n=1 Tax=Cohnella terricola TaxID=1289167 RepID=A0A559JEE8_9BACL|nr:hypothetical protein [Cohnella terricola]TVX98264.1 hypothetical protein FPZ45_16320 [Cohnella terricola]